MKRRMNHRANRIQRSIKPIFLGFVPKNLFGIFLKRNRRSIPKTKEAMNRITRIHQPKGENIKEIGDSLKKLRLIFGISESAFSVSLKLKFSISPTAREYLRSLYWLETRIS